MSTGYGRGYYGSAQLAPPRGGGWYKIAAVAGLGAVIWWWVLPAIGARSKRAEEHKPSPSSGEPPPNEDLDQHAQSRGFSSTKTYEDSMVALARELRASGAKVELAPHFQHLESRLEP